MRIIGLSVLLLAGLGIGWALGKAMLGPSRINKTQPAVSAASVIEDKSDSRTAETTPIADLEAKALEAKADDVQGLSAESQDQKAIDGRSLRARSSGSARRPLAIAKARTGPGIGIVTKPIKVIFKPLKRVNPFKLRVW